MASQNTARAQQRPTGLKPWKPGQSGNPGGRPKGLASRIREVCPPERLTEFYEAVFTNDVAFLGDDFKVTLQDRMKAGDWLADRGYGRPAQYTPVEDADPLELSNVDRKITSVLDELAAKRKTPAARRRKKTPVASSGPSGADPA